MSLLAAVAFPAASALGQRAAPSTAARTIEVSGHGEARAKPDTLVASFAVETNSSAADECARLNALATNKVIDALKAKLGGKGTTNTSDYSIGSAYPPANPPAPEPAERKVATWKFRSEVAAMTDAIEILGPVVEAGLAAGATLGSSGIRWAVPPPMSMLGVPMTGGKTVPYISFNVVAEGSTAAECIREGSRMTAKVEQALKEKLGKKGQVDVANFGVEPIYQAATPTPAPQAAQFYSAHNTVTVETQELPLLAEVLQAAISAGATRINSVSFTLRDDKQAKAEAITKASEDARRKAEAAAASSGVKLKNVLKISTVASVRPETVGLAAEALSSGYGYGVGVSAGALASMPRQVTVPADVTMIYEIE